MSLDLVKYPNPLLTKKSEDCKEEDLSFILAQLPEMTKIMLDNKGIGLAAIQVGIVKRFTIMLNSSKEIDLVINPVVLEVEQETQKDNEGCLSLPMFWEQIERPIQVLIEYRDRDWTLRKAVCYGLMARCILHEIEHMDGILQVDKVSVMKRQMWQKKLKKRS